MPVGPAYHSRTGVIKLTYDTSLAGRHVGKRGRPKVSEAP